MKCHVKIHYSHLPADSEHTLDATWPYLAVKNALALEGKFWKWHPAKKHVDGSLVFDCYKGIMFHKRYRTAMAVVTILDTN